MKHFVVKLYCLLTVVKSRREDNLYCFPFVVLQVLTTLLFGLFEGIGFTKRLIDWRVFTALNSKKD